MRASSKFLLQPQKPAPASQAIIGGLKKYSFCNPYDLFTICAIRRCVDYKQVLFCFVLETGIQRTLTSNPDQGHGSIPIGSWESSCSSEKHLNSCEADFVRVSDDGKVLGEGRELPRKRPGYSSSRFYRGEKLQISASLVVCRTERTINSCWEPRLLAIHTKVSHWGSAMNYLYKTNQAPAIKLCWIDLKHENIALIAL